MTNAMSATTTIQVVSSVTVTRLAQLPKFATETPVSVFAKKDMMEQDAINASLVTSDSPTVRVATVTLKDPLLLLAQLLESVDVFPTMVASNVPIALSVTMVTLTVFPATVTLLDLMDFLVTLKENVSAKETLMAKNVPLVGKDSTTILPVKNAIVIQQESL